MIPIISDSRSYFNRSRGSVSLNIDPDNGSYYSPSSDKITILESDADGSSFGDLVLAHEYGHAFHEKGLGGNVAGGNCPSPHYVDGEHNLQCAYSEGFANYHSESLEFNYFDFENRDYTYGGSSDGSIVEGAVASFLLDVTDPSNESFDNLNLSGSYVANIIETCEVYNSSWQRGDGIDHLIACFEQVIPDYANYFTTRNSTPTDFRESVTEPSGWDATEILRLWRRNLYSENL